jgi:hypothetical protein
VLEAIWRDSTIIQGIFNAAFRLAWARFGGPMDDELAPFSERHGYELSAVEITVREDAPEALRVGLISLASRSGLSSDSIREVGCQVLLTRPDPNNWSKSNVDFEIAHLIDDATWYRVYDIAEQLHHKLGSSQFTGYVNPEAQRFEQGFNQLCREHGIGWKMENGNILARGDEGFELAVQQAKQTMQNHGNNTAREELHEALQDISRRPKADVTGAIQHAMAALECVARDVGQTRETLGRAVKSLNLPSPLDSTVRQLWGFSSNQGRHVLEGNEPDFDEAELVVGLAASLSVYILRKGKLPRS